VESKWKNYHIITFPGQSLSKNRETHQWRKDWRKLNIALFGELRLEEAMDLSRDRLILELEHFSVGWGLGYLSRYSYELDGRWLIPGRGKRLYVLHSVQTGFAAHPASYTMGTGGDFPRSKVAGACH
jgi:hypothetical protein